MNLESLSIAGVKNRSGKSQLNEELYRIDRERRAEMRMHNTSKQRFRAKYSKLDYYTNRGKDASDVRMYETHNPGFCYRRNGECRTLQVSSTSPTINFEEIHSLLFTAGEVDIEKVLCLHLLTAHKTETLTPPTKYHRSLSFLTKEQSPLERLIERSRKRRQQDSLTKLLPTYILDVKQRKDVEDDKQEEEVLIRDGRLAERVIINDKINQLVHTVMAALQDSNPEKMKIFLNMANNPDTLNEIVEKPHIQDFLQALNGHIIVSSCESFHLTQPFKATTVALELKTSTNGLEKLVKHIRQNVLQFPEESTWKTMYEKSQIRTEESLVISETNFKNKSNDFSGASSRDTVATEASASVNTRTNFIEKNKETAFKHQIKSKDGSVTSSIKRKFSSGMGPKSSNISVKIRFTGSRGNRHDNGNNLTGINDSTNAMVGEERVIRNTEFYRSNPKTLGTILSKVPVNEYHWDNKSQIIIEEDSDSVASEMHSPRIPIKQTICPACLKKWKSPLASPKTSKKSLPQPKLEQISNNEVKGGTAQKLSKMTDEKIKKLNIDERRYGKTSRISALRQSTFKTLQAVALDVLDLAKIRQEIKEKETQKKVQKFLESNI